MPFTGVSTMDRKREFVGLAGVDGEDFGELCRRFGISRTLGYRILARYREAGVRGLEDRSRRPLRSPRRTSAEIEAEVLAVRAAHPAWGGRKIAAVLKRRGLPIILISHNMPHVFEVADRIHIHRLGRRLTVTPSS